eukprot:8021976-Heterocapsa_arctica.AAC.1
MVIARMPEDRPKTFENIYTNLQTPSKPYTPDPFCDLSYLFMLRGILKTHQHSEASRVRC